MATMTALGQNVSYNQPFSAALLQAIPRRVGRQALGIGMAAAPLPFVGEDVWTAYEISWLRPCGLPQVAIATIRVPAASPQLIESKSLKLYLGALAQTHWAEPAALEQVLSRELGAAAGAPVEVALHAPAAFAAQVPALPWQGGSLDALEVPTTLYHVEPALLRLAAGDGAPVAQTWFTDLFRSNCPVTGQPDYGSVRIDAFGPPIEASALLQYLVSYRLHVGFHEQCIERIFVDLQARCGWERLAVQGRFTRRGGLDINPYRSSHAPARAPGGRLPRQ